MLTRLILITPLLVGCGSHISDEEKLIRSDRFMARKTPTGGKVLEVINRNIPTASHSMSWPSTAFKGAEWIYEFRGRCFYMKANYWRQGDDILEVDCK